MSISHFDKLAGLCQAYLQTYNGFEALQEELNRLDVIAKAESEGRIVDEDSAESLFAEARMSFVTVENDIVVVDIAPTKEALRMAIVSTSIKLSNVAVDLSALSAEVVKQIEEAKQCLANTKKTKGRNSQTNSPTTPIPDSGSP